jgi:hypothetical protein
MQLLVKIYPDGKLSSHLDAVPLGGKMDFKHIAPNVKIQYPFNKKRIGIICGGTGGKWASSFNGNMLLLRSDSIFKFLVLYLVIITGSVHHHLCAHVSDSDAASSPRIARFTR